jgi:hypothetical protein
MSQKTHFTRSGPYAWVNSLYSENVSPGNVYYACSVNGTDATSSGFSPENPFASIAFAVLQCAADNGDLVMVLPGHIESVATAGQVNMSVAGVTVRGWGVGRQRPQIKWTNTAGTWTITAARCVVENIWFTPGTVGAVNFMTVSAADCAIRNCEFELANGSASNTGQSILTTAAADRLKIEDNDFKPTGANGTGLLAISLVGGNAIRIRRNVIQGKFGSGVGGITGATTDSLDLVVDGNIITNRTASSTKAITLTSGTTGSVSNNRLGILSGSAPITGAALDHVGGNYYTNAAGVTAGTLI